MAHKVLIVEDEDALRDALRIKLDKEGFTCIEAQDGQEALEKVFVTVPDIILLDMALPIVDGPTFLKKILDDHRTNGIPVIVLTNFTDIEKISEALACGVHEYLVKSDWRMSDIVKRVRERLEERAQLNEKRK